MGSAAQIKSLKKVAGKLKLDLAQFRELAAFGQFASDLDPQTKARIELGRRLTEVLKQVQYQPFLVENQVAVIYAVTNGYLDDVPVEKVKDWEEAFHKFMNAQYKSLLQKLTVSKDFEKDAEPELKKAINEFNKSYVS